MSVVVRMAGTKLYTTPYDDGTFSFYNLHEGQYQVEIDVATIPDGYLLASPAARGGGRLKPNPAPPIRFELKLKPPVEKRVREMLNQEIHVTTPAAKTKRIDDAKDAIQRRTKGEQRCSSVPQNRLWTTQEDCLSGVGRHSVLGGWRPSLRATWQHR